MLEEQYRHHGIPQPWLGRNILLVIERTFSFFFRVFVMFSHIFDLYSDSFIENFGTHVITSVTIGGKDVIYVKQHESSSLSSMDIKSYVQDIGNQRFSSTESLTSSGLLKYKDKASSSVLLSLHLFCDFFNFQFYFQIIFYLLCKPGVRFVQKLDNLLLPSYFLPSKFCREAILLYSIAKGYTHNRVVHLFSQGVGKRYALLSHEIAALLVK